MSNIRLLMLVDDLYEDLELWYSVYFLRSQGLEVLIAGPESMQEYKGKFGYPCISDVSVTHAQPRGFSGVVIPGGLSALNLRESKSVKELINSMHSQGKLIAFIGHGGWVPVSAGIMKEVLCTASPQIKDDIVNSGGTWSDDSVVKDRHFVSARNADDLPKFCNEIIRFFEQGGSGENK